MGNDALRDLVRQLRSRRLDRRQFFAGAAALGFSTAAANSALRTSSVWAQASGNVVVWTTHTSSTALAALEKIVADFNGQNTGVTVELVRKQGNETDTTALTTAIRGGVGPDVYMLDRFIVAERAAQGFLQDLTAYVGGQDISGNYVPFAWAEANYDGKLFALPFDTDARALYYNKGMIQAAGADPSRLDSTSGPITFETVNEIAAMVNKTDADGNYSQMGFVPWFDQGWHYTYGFAFGGTFFDEAKCQVTPDNEGVVAGHQYLYDYAKAQDAQKINAFIGPFLWPAVYATETHPFTTQRLAMVITGDWYLAQLKQFAPDLDFGVSLIPVPAGSEESATWAGGWSLVIPQGAKNPEAGWTFMQYMAGEPGQRTYTQMSDALPTLTSLLADASLYDENHKFFAEKLLPVAKNRPPLPVGALYWNELTSAWQKVYLNEEEPQSALATVKERVQPDLESFCPISVT